MKFQYIIFTLLALIILSSCENKEQNQKLPETKEEKPLNVILLIGDGMGVSQLSSSFYFNKDESNFNRFKHIGLFITSSASHKITDSGASGTALSCGIKSYNGVIGMDSDTNVAENITEKVSKLGYSTGVISTSSITHATPACYYAHVPSRSMEEEIAAQLVNSEIDFFAGGGYNFFTKRADGKNLFEDLSANGFIIDTNKLQFEGTPILDKKYGFLLAPDHLPEKHEGRDDFLPNATKLALDYLSMSDSGFFIMVEGSQIDWAGHANNTEFMVEEVIDFDKTIGVAMDFAETHENTLVIVTADHETGGFTLAGKGAYGEDSDYNTIEPRFATDGHSASLIPVFAFGPGAEEFTGIYQHNLLIQKVYELIKSE